MENVEVSAETISNDEFQERLRAVQERIFMENIANVGQSYDDIFQQDSLFTCGCCYEDVEIDSMVQCIEGHLFCALCLRRYAEESIFGQGTSGLKCMTEDCDSTFSREQLIKALPEAVFEKYEDQKLQDSLNTAGLEDFVRCKFCSFGAELDPNVLFFHCLKCDKQFCRKCEELFEVHQGLTCEQIEKNDETQIRKTYEEKMADAKIRTCSKCKARFTKESGCNLITCPCTTTMCYICRKPNVKYDHFCRHQNGVTCGRCGTECALYSNDVQDDERAIRELQEIARNARIESGFVQERTIGVPSTNNETQVPNATLQPRVQYLYPRPLPQAPQYVAQNPIAAPQPQAPRYVAQNPIAAPQPRKRGIFAKYHPNQDMQRAMILARNQTVPGVEIPPPNPNMPMAQVVEHDYVLVHNAPPPLVIPPIDRQAVHRVFDLLQSNRQGKPNQGATNANPNRAAATANPNRAAATANPNRAAATANPNRAAATANPNRAAATANPNRAAATANPNRAAATANPNRAAATANPNRAAATANPNRAAATANPNRAAATANPNRAAATANPNRAAATANPNRAAATANPNRAAATANPNRAAATANPNRAAATANPNRAAATANPNRAAATANPNRAAATANPIQGAGLPISNPIQMGLGRSHPSLSRAHSSPSKQSQRILAEAIGGNPFLTREQCFVTNSNVPVTAGLLRNNTVSGRTVLRPVQPAMAQPNETLRDPVSIGMLTTRMGPTRLSNYATNFPDYHFNANTAGASWSLNATPQPMNGADNCLPLRRDPLSDLMGGGLGRGRCMPPRKPPKK